MDLWLLISEGIWFGLTLAILLGPIFVALTQTGIEKGIRAGILVGTGIWISDIIIISILVFMMGHVNPEDFEGQFKRYFGIIGGLVLITIGIATALKKAEYLDSKVSFSAKSIGGYWLKGFLVNTVNPFTFIFWTTLITSFVIVKNLSTKETIIFFGSIMTTVIVTDILKVVGSKSIRNRLTKKHLSYISKIAGMALIVFGILLMIRSWK